MIVANDIPQMDYIDYFTRQLPLNLASMAALRDELVIRQGALSAAQDALHDRELARQELTAASEDRIQARVDAAEIIAAALALRTEAEARIVDADRAVKEAEVAGIAVAKREASVEKIEARQAKTAVVLDTRAAGIEQDTLALEARVKAFQAKVASLSA
jgi:hypothetical protein